MYQGCPPIESSEFLEILDPLISETGPSNFAESDSMERISVDCIGQKPKQLAWQTGTSGFLRM
jgi:hypothetical protein